MSRSFLHPGQSRFAAAAERRRQRLAALSSSANSAHSHPNPGGGLDHHKPDCHCVGCKNRALGQARARSAEAVSFSAGAGGKAMAAFAHGLGTLNADLPDIIVKDPNTCRAKIAEWIKIRSEEPDLTNVAIAQRMGIGRSYLQGLITRARKEGWLVFEDPLAKIEHEIIPKVVDNLNHFLDQKDRTVTIEAAKGTIFKQYQASKGISETMQTVIALKIERTEGDDTKVITGQIVGKPRELEE